MDSIFRATGYCAFNDIDVREARRLNIFKQQKKWLGTGIYFYLHTDEREVIVYSKCHPLFEVSGEFNTVIKTEVKCKDNEVIDFTDENELRLFNKTIKELKNKLCVSLGKEYIIENKTGRKINFDSSDFILFVIDYYFKKLQGVMILINYVPGNANPYPKVMCVCNDKCIVKSSIKIVY